MKKNRELENELSELIKRGWEIKKRLKQIMSDPEQLRSFGKLCFTDERLKSFIDMLDRDNIHVKTRLKQDNSPAMQKSLEALYHSQCKALFKMLDIVELNKKTKLLDKQFNAKMDIELFGQVMTDEQYRDGCKRLNDTELDIYIRLHDKLIHGNSNRRIIDYYKHHRTILEQELCDRQMN